MLKRFHVTLFAILFVLALSAPCGAAELVQNGGFETGTFSSWTTTPASSGSVFGVSTTNPHTGIYAAYYGAVGTQDDSISQTLATVAGQSYSISFWLAHPFTTTANDFHVFWNGSPVFSTNGAANFGYTQFSTTQTAGAGPSVITFSGLENPAYFYLDDVSVTGPQSVPEPASLLLFGFGLVGLAWVRRMMRGMQFKTNIMEGTMKTHLRLAVMICGLLLVAAPAMAQVLPPGIQIFDNDANAPGISVVTSGTFFNSNLVVIQETPTGQGSVTWDFSYFSQSARTGPETFAYNIFEQGGAVPAQLSDTLLLTLTPRVGPAVVTTLGHLEFFSGPLNDTPPLNALLGGFTIIETGALQDLLVAGIPHPTDMFELKFQSDLDAPTNVPEPASLLLFGFGLVGIAGIGRKIGK